MVMIRIALDELFELQAFYIAQVLETTTDGSAYIDRPRIIGKLISRR